MQVQRKIKEFFLVYEVTCNTINKQYIGATQQNAKDRMSGHFSNVKQLVCKDVHSDF